jgi:hypothetical protein
MVLTGMVAAAAEAAPTAKQRWRNETACSANSETLTFAGAAEPRFGGLRSPPITPAFPGINRIAITIEQLNGIEGYTLSDAKVRFASVRSEATSELLEAATCDRLRWECYPVPSRSRLATC